VSDRRQKVEWGEVSLRLSNRIGVEGRLLETIIRRSGMRRCELLLVLDDKDGFGYEEEKRRGIAFAAEDLNFVDPQCCYRRDIPIEDLVEIKEWDAAIYIPRISGEKHRDFGAYFALVLRHELEHVKIIRANLELHRCVSWLFNDNFTIFKEGGCDCSLKKTWEFPWELHCNKMGKKLAEDVFGSIEVTKCLRELICIETSEHQEYLSFLCNLRIGTQKDGICEGVLRGIREYYSGLEAAAHKVWKMRKSAGYEFANQFDLQKFIPHVG
jgi:hypothetical protein